MSSNGTKESGRKNRTLPPEDFLHYIWKVRRIDLSDLKTEGGNRLAIDDWGSHNTDAGPDFLHARISMDGAVWAGQVEMHVLASDWYRHGHQDDPAYRNVILHVVWENDAEVRRPDGTLIPTLVIGHRVHPSILEKFSSLRATLADIPCRRHLGDVRDVTWADWKQRLLVERLQRKSERLRSNWEECERNWEQLLFRAILRYAGQRLNRDAFEELAMRTPYLSLLRERSNPLAVEAILFGQSGLLHKQHRDPYPQSLWREYRHLRVKYGLTPLSPAMWKFMRQRPHNFPTVRIAQIAALVRRNGNMFRRAISEPGALASRSFWDAGTHAYWDTHFRFDIPSATRKKKIGRQAVQVLRINAFVPVLFLYGRETGEDRLVEQAIRLLHDIGKEENKVIRQWRKMGVGADSAADSQALLELMLQYCHPKKCLHCRIGHEILK